MRFSRRQLRERTGWGDTQLKVHLARLVDLELVVAHRADKGNGLVYELAWDGQGKDGERFALGPTERSEGESGRPVGTGGRFGTGRRGGDPVTISPTRAMAGAHISRPRHELLREAFWPSSRCSRGTPSMAKSSGLAAG